MKPATWTELTLSLPAKYQDLLVGQLAAIGFQGFLQENDSLGCYIPKNLWKPALKKSLQDLIERFQREFRGLECNWHVRLVKHKNWNAAWERSIGVVEATQKIVIAPSWKKLRKRDKGKIVLRIDPKMAFGTGHHETTRLSLVLLEDYLRPGSRVLDVGTGTGVLAIAAVKLGAQSALGIDNDEWAIDNARENVVRNNVSRAARIQKGDATKKTKSTYDLITANIDLPTMTLALKTIVRSLKPQGTIIVSGLLQTDLSRFMDLISHLGIIPLEMLTENEWVAVSLTKLDARRGH